MYKTRLFQLREPFLTKSIWCDVSMMCLGVILAFVSATMFFEFFDLRNVKALIPTMFLQAQTPLRAAAKENVIVENAPAAVVSQNTSNNYAFRGDHGISFMKFRIVAPEDIFLKEIILNMDQFSQSYDLKNLQLYSGNVMLQEAAFFEGKGAFKDLLIKIPKNKEIWLQVKGTLSEQAHVGDRIRLLFADKESIKITNTAGDAMTFNNDYPIKGNIVSVIGKTLTDGNIGISK